MKCTKCEKYSFKVRRCLDGKVNPKTKKDTKQTSELMGIEYICKLNKWRADILTPKQIEKTFTYFSDPSHGWLRVKRQDLITLGILDKITSYSYQNNSYVYLEEDLDASLFLSIAKQNHWNVKIKERTGNCLSLIRSYDHFNI